MLILYANTLADVENHDSFSVAHMGSDFISFREGAI